MKKSGLLFFTAIMILQGCTGEETHRLPAQEVYYKALMQFEEQSFKEAKIGFEKVIEENPGTRLATVSYLKLGDLNFAGTNWNEAETNYQAFLTHSPNSHLTPYVLSQLISLNYQRNVQGVFFRSRNFDRDMEPNRKIIEEYQRFFFLYANNAYLQDTKEFLSRAQNDLAEHEFLVGNFYFEHKAYDSAILRYLHLLKTYSQFPRVKEVGLRLVEAYKANQQPHLAKEMQKAIEVRFAPSRNP
ncbi:MAG: outer membrane protein assembly factor BamD [SAR324 cluster bacterium]|nr:outer membrane protein assembly factor BamD [SAR324 cluster bacterium]